MRALRAGGRLLHTITRMPRSGHVVEIYLLKKDLWQKLLTSCYSRYKAAGILKLYNKVRPVPGQCQPLATVTMTMIMTIIMVTMMVVTIIMILTMVTMTITIVTMLIMTMI